MAALIRVTCTECGDLQLTPLDLRGRVCLDNDNSEYRFTCPDCAKVTVKQTERRVIDLLKASGVRVDLWSLPRELFEEHNGEQISHNDLLTFHVSLEDDAAFEKALSDL